MSAIASAASNVTVNVISFFIALSELSAQLAGIAKRVQFR